MKLLIMIMSVVTVSIFTYTGAKRSDAVIENVTTQRYDQTFVFRNDNVTQTLMCNWPKDGKVEFKYIHNPVGGKESIVTGVATYKPSEETGVDEDGNAYYMEKYEFINGCTIVLRLDADENRRAMVMVSNCPAGNATNAIQSVGIMHAQL